MIFIRQKRILPRSQSVDNHTDDIEHRNNQSRKSQNHIRVYYRAQNEAYKEVDGEKRRKALPVKELCVMAASGRHRAAQNETFT